jgi:hypothetical protein
MNNLFGEGETKWQKAVSFASQFSQENTSKTQAHRRVRQTLAPVQPVLRIRASGVPPDRMYSRI